MRAPVRAEERIFYACRERELPGLFDRVVAAPDVALLVVASCES
ncbi:hypothetical protein [Nannocystis punicea]|uniref:Uncharacterized protein n=1 Tax=Nannocystis punicea TaxID=2995304 RepID=A0ABY7H439_9BACT|nr:hypothetical protein [Nannocystis poenicansa]WAS93784.1 hypothetical protein O0S08_47230 [Nannocystis poenicansa]